MLLQEDASVEVYDFSRPTTLARQQARLLEAGFDTFARQWSTTITAKARALAKVTFQSLEVVTYVSYTAALPQETSLVLLTFDEVAERAVIQFPLAAALGWVGSMLGGTGSAPVPERRYTPLEQALVRRLVADLSEDLDYSFGELLEPGIAVDSVHYNPQFAQAASPSDLMVAATFEVQVGDTVDTATVALPLTAVLPRLGSPNAVEPAPDAPDRLRRHLEWVPVPVSVRLAERSVTPREVLGLAVGDVIALPHAHHRPFEVSVHGRRVARAAAGAVGARLAGVIVDLEETS